MNLITAICNAARKWENPEYPARASATKKTLKIDNRFTEESIAFAINQQMDLLVEEELKTWSHSLNCKTPETVGVINPGNIPFVELQDLLAVVLSGHKYLGSISSKSTYLLPAFISEIRNEGADIKATFVQQKDVFGRCQKLIASGSNETITEIAAIAARAGLQPDQCLLRGHRYSIAVLDGWEEEDTLVMLAEDALMHEGMGCRSVSILFAPENMGVDSVLEAFALHRGVFPAHEATSKSIKMQQAYADALKLPNAFAEDFQFLVSKGEPLEQGICHIRWVSYSDIDEVEVWLKAQEKQIQCVFSDERFLSQHPDWLPIGTAQRPSLDWRPDGVSHASFLSK